MDLKTLTEAFGPSGCEHEVRDLLRKAAEAVCQDVSLDRMGNLVCRRPGSDPSKPSVAVAAHMDEVGFIVVGHNDDGLLRFRSIGGVDPRVVVSKWVKVGPDRLPGVIGALAIHLQTPADRERVLQYDSLFIDIGAKDKAEAESLAPLGTYAVFDTSFAEFGQGMVCTKALDDRVGCFNLLKILEMPYEGDLCCVFVTQEEVGLRGATGAAYLVQPDIAIVLEGTSANDLGDVPDAKKVCVPGQGVAISFMDNASIGDRELYRSMMQTAQDRGIPHQAKRGSTGGNDAGAFQRSGRGASTLVLSVPCRYIHAGNSVAMWSDIQAQEDLVRAWLQQL